MLARPKWGGGAEALFKTWMFSGVLVASSAMCLARAALVRTSRPIWTAFGTGMLLWALGSIYWSAFVKGHAGAPEPSAADVLYLSFYPAVYVALMLLIRPHLRGIGPSVWLDGLIGVLAVGAVGTALLAPSVIANTGGGTAVVMTNLAFPLCDLLLIAIVVGGFAVSGWRPGRTWALIGGGLVLFAVADSIYLYRVATDVFVEGTWLDALWPGGMLLLAIAAWQTPPRVSPPAEQTWWVLVAPLLLSCACLAVLVYGNTGHISPASLALAAGTVLAAFVRLVLTFREVRALSETRRQAITDELTGLPNRRLLYERLQAQARSARAEGSSLTLLVADLDRFKELNDTLGHDAGDLLLKRIGPRVLDALHAGDTLARLGGDEFAVVLPGLQADDAVAVVKRIQAAIDEPFTLRGLRIHIEASIGLACFPHDASDPETLVRRAEVAMYQAKESRVGFETYDPERDVHSRDRLSLLGDLHSAIDNGEFELYYQPKVELRTCAITGVEVLIRWHHPQRGLLVPMQFIPLAEHTAVMRPLTLHVLDSALRQCKLWRDDGLLLSVAVNLSVPNLLDLRLGEDVAHLLQKWEVPPDQLHLEVTENIILSDPVRVLEVLGSLKEIGVGLSLDDFGTGSSSLFYLKRLPIDELKIDKSFVLSMHESKADEVIVRSTTELAQRLGLRVVAEGVENEEVWELLTRIGCDEAQGYFLQRPIAATELGEWIAGWTAAEEEKWTREANRPVAPRTRLPGLRSTPSRQAKPPS